MQTLDWLILLGMAAFVSALAFTTKKYTRSVADFLAASRCAGKYTLAVADGIAGMGAISIIALFEMYYRAGFSGVWWSAMVLPFGVVIALSGWVQYRYRQTRVLTMAQFMEIRYSRRFRVFSGFICFFSGIVNFGIFPAVGGRFFQYFCGLPAYPVSLGIFEFDLTFAIIMAILLTISLVFTFLGGQITVIVTDFAQGLFCNIAFLVLAVYIIYFLFDWGVMVEAFATAPPGASMINPAQSGDTEDYNATYFLVGLFATFLTFMAWQGNQGYYGCARTPHAARMGRVIGTIRPLVQNTAVVLLALAAFTLLNHSSFTEDAAIVEQTLSIIENEQIRNQQTVTVALSHLLPTGLLGVFAAVMFAAFISTHDTYLHSWGSIFIQDVILPIRLLIRGDNTPISRKAHIRLLRFSILGVALFIFLFSLFFSQQQDILMFFALTSTIYLGWAGWAICGGLYWKGGNTTGVWVAACLGMTLAVLGWFLTYQWATFQSLFQALSPTLWQQSILRFPSLAGDRCPVNAQIILFWTMIITGGSYVGTSLLSRGEPFNMDRMLHRGRYAIEGDDGGQLPARGLRAFRLDHHFGWDDKILYVASISYTLLVFSGFLTITVLFTVFRVDFGDSFWSSLWSYYIVAMLCGGGIVTVWIAVGGIVDIRQLFIDMSRVRRDADDDGTVVGDRSLTDLKAEADDDPYIPGEVNVEDTP